MLLGILLFNWCGYRLVINYLQTAADSRLEARLDRNDYDESQLIEIKVPVNMPYQSDWAGFERVDGEIEVNGVHYKYVKRKVQDGQLVLKCIPNTDKQALEAAKDDIFKMNNDLQQDNASKKSGNPLAGVVKNLLGDADRFDQTLFSWAETIAQPHYNLCQPQHAVDRLISTPEQPPEA